MAEIFVTPNQIAIELKCSLRVARRYIVSEMTHLRAGRFLRVSFREYERWKASKRKTQDADGAAPDPRLVMALAEQMRTGKIKLPPGFVLKAEMKDSEFTMRTYAKALARDIRREAAERASRQAPAQAQAAGGAR